MCFFNVRVWKTVYFYLIFVVGNMFILPLSANDSCFSDVLHHKHILGHEIMQMIFLVVYNKELYEI